MRRHLPVIVEQDSDGVYIVEYPSLKSCRSYGHTIEEAMDNILEAIEGSLEEMLTPGDITFIGARDLEVNIA